MRSYTSKGRTPAESLGFELDGIRWECESDVSVLDLSEYARLAQQGVDSGSPQGVAIIADVYSGLLGDSYQQFRAHCRKHGTDGETLVRIIGDLIAEAAERPTSRPSDSTDGPPADPDSVKVISFSRATVEQKPIEEEPKVRVFG